MEERRRKRGPRRHDKDFSWQMTKKAIDRRKAQKNADLELYNSLCGPVTITYVNPKADLTDSKNS